MASIVKFSNIIISRAGAGAIKEFANACTCVILIPFKKGSRGDQIKNAKLLKNTKCLHLYRWRWNFKYKYFESYKRNFKW